MAPEPAGATLKLRSTSLVRGKFPELLSVRHEGTAPLFPVPRSWASDGRKWALRQRKFFRNNPHPRGVRRAAKMVKLDRGPARPPGRAEGRWHEAARRERRREAGSRPLKRETRRWLSGF